MQLGPKSASRAPLAARLLTALDQLGFDPATGILGLAVSGGGDSMAMLHLARDLGLRVQVATVDHGLRPEAADEARMVAQVAHSMGYDHQILVWRGWDGRGNVQDRARRARRALLADWAQARGLDAVALAHSQDDLAETFLMRLARGAGVDGLAAMQPRFAAEGAVFLRPLLAATRDELRAYLTARRAQWVDDPSNDQMKFDRVRARKAQPLLQNLGIGAQVLAEVAQHMRAASVALEAACDDLARRVMTESRGIITLSEDWRAAPPEVQRRLIQRAILWIAPADYAPRGAALQGAIARIERGLPTQLAGCHLLPQQGKILAFREARRAAPACAANALWDGIWRLTGAPPAYPHIAAQIGPLGQAGLAQWQGWRSTGLPRAALISQPSLWRDGQMIFTPLCPDLAPSYAFFRHPSADSLYSMRLAD
ncbi:MAG: tRNA lysidine(34) synthetase TilS [Cypionkella sp.]|nr:tRNA lysidine(34) synthetase TilS [Cypionkella sp.]